MDSKAPVSSGDSEPAKSRLWLGVMYAGGVIILLAAPVVYFDLGGRLGKSIGFPVFCFGAFLAFAGSFLHAVFTGEIPLTKRPCRKQDGAAGYYVCLAVSGAAALMFLAVCIKFCLEAPPGS